mmetsp:Transcript_7034/g.14284  ORF Transcript_7034/g.14284 Transcript_7034/m.14284 type:complete len:606 (+) Transcript_7034:85-1902(+)
MQFFKGGNNSSRNLSSSSGESASSSSFGFSNFQRRLKETALDKLGVREILSDNITNDSLIDEPLRMATESLKSLKQAKLRVMAHMEKLKAFQDSAMLLSQSDISLFGDDTPIVSEFSKLANGPIYKCTEHCLSENCITLINQAMEFCGMIVEKSKRRHNHILDYTHNKRLWQSKSEKKVEREKDTEKHDEEVARRKMKLDVSISTVQDANQELHKLLSSYLSIAEEVKAHVQSAFLASHAFYAQMMLNACKGTAKSPLLKELEEIHEGVAFRGKTLRVFKNQHVKLREQIMSIVGGTEIKYANEQYSNSEPTKNATKKALYKSASFDVKGRSSLAEEDGLPQVLTESLVYLDKNGLESEGLFRVAGLQDSVDDLLKHFEENEKHQEDLLETDEECKMEVTVPNVASLLKLWLRNLPTSLIPEKSYRAITKVAQKGKKELLSVVEKEMEEWGAEHIEVLAILLAFLFKIASNSEVNKMTSENLAIVFAPTILRPPEDINPMEIMNNVSGSIIIVKTLIENVYEVFGQGVNEALALLGIESVGGGDGGEADGEEVEEEETRPPPPPKPPSAKPPPPPPASRAPPLPPAAVAVPPLLLSKACSSRSLE